VFWGEAMLSPVHSLSYGQSALDLGKLFSVPGTETKELFPAARSHLGPGPGHA
jgi:hypothetical protein